MCPTSDHSLDTGSTFVDSAADRVQQKGQEPQLCGTYPNRFFDTGPTASFSRIPVAPVARTKASQDHTVWVPIARNPTSRWCPVTALEQWISELDELGDRVDASLTVWPWITKGDTVRAGNPPIGGALIDAIVSRRVTNSGLVNASSYSTHSSRSGFVSEAENRGVDEADTRLESLRIMRLYHRSTGWWNRNPTTSMTL